MPFDQAHKQYEIARHLPPPLYVLFVQATAYGQACGEYGLDEKRDNENSIPANGVVSKHVPRRTQVTGASSPLHRPAWLPGLADELLD